MGRCIKVARVVSSSAALHKKQKNAKRRKKKPANDHPASGNDANSTALPSFSSTSEAVASSMSSVASAHAPRDGGIAIGMGGKECLQCGNSMWSVGSKKVTTWASNGCLVCDYVGYRKTQRACVHCERNQCEYFCEWCGNGYHLKCAKVLDENVTSPHGFCCKKCEAEQLDDENGTKDEDENSIARCGSCELPFNSSSNHQHHDESDADDDSDEDDKRREETNGFHVNQCVLVENEDVLYNAVITAVDSVGERIKIHFIRWSKSFDNWYAMDDERINESLACDCCNQWFHIGCLPPIKSCGRRKDTTYVCPTCIDEAKVYHSGTRKASTSKSTSKSSRRPSIADEIPEPRPKKKSSKPVITSDDDDDDDGAEDVDDERHKEESEEEEVGTKPKKSKRKRTLSDASTSEKKAKGSSASRSSADQSSSMSKKRRSKSSERVSKSNTVKRETATSDPSGEDRYATSHGSLSSPERRRSPTPSDQTDGESSRRNSNATDSAKGAATQRPDVEDPAVVTEKPLPPVPVRRKVSCHSMAALLNSPSSSDTYSEPFKPRAVSHPLVDPSSPYRAAYVKVEKESPAAPALSRKRKQRERDEETSRNWPRSSTKRTGNGSTLSAFDILREVATQSIESDLSDSGPSRTTSPHKPNDPMTRVPPVKNKEPRSTKSSSSNQENDDRMSAQMKRMHSMNSFVDLHFNIRKEMYLRFCELEESGLLEAETAQLLRALIYPTSDRFQDLKFVYLVNKDMLPAQLVKRLLELIPPVANAILTSLASAAIVPSSCCSSATCSPKCHAANQCNPSSSSPCKSNGTSVVSSTITITSAPTTAFTEDMTKQQPLGEPEPQESRDNSTSSVSYATDPVAT